MQPYAKVEFSHNISFMTKGGNTTEEEATLPCTCIHDKKNSTDAYLYTVYTTIGSSNVKSA